jgi:hypothetical protein
MRFIFCSLLLANLALANGPLPLPRLDAPIKLDGINRSDESDIDIDFPVNITN